MAQKSAMMTRRIRFLKTAEDGVTYEIISTTNGIHIDQEGNVTPLRLTARAYMRKGAERTPLTTNDNGTESEYCLLLSMAEGQSLLPAAGTSTAIFKMSSSSVARIDLVRGPLLGKAGSSNSYVYSEDHILATLPVLIQRDGQDGDSAYFTSIVFKRSDTLLTSADTPVGGTYLSPVPPGWSDAPPAGNAALWMSRARITPEMDGEAGSPTPQWSVPSPVADQSGIEYIFSHKESPGAPVNTHPYPTDPTAAGDWGKDPTDAIWMGVALKNNGIWGEWALVRIKGETGPTGPAAEWHEIALSAESVYIKGIQTDPQSVTATVWKVTGGVRTQLTHLQMAASAMQIACTVYQKNGTEQKFYSGISGGVSGGIGGIGGTTSSLHSLSVLASNFIGATRVEFSVTKGLTETVCVKALLLQIAGEDGEDGDDGEDGLMMPPPRRWEDYPEGYLFQSGQPGDVRIDTVVYSDDNGQYLSARCRVRHMKSALHHPKTDNTALKTVAQNPYWTAQDGTYELVATNVLLAANAFIKLLSSRGIAVYDADGSIAGKLQGGAWPFLLGGDTAETAVTKIGSDGTLYCRKGVIEGDVVFAGKVLPMETRITTENWRQYAIRESEIDGKSPSDPYYQFSYNTFRLDFRKLTGRVVLCAGLDGLENADGTGLVPSIFMASRYKDCMSIYTEGIDDCIGSRMIIKNETAGSFGLTGYISDKENLSSSFSTSIESGYEASLECRLRLVSGYRNIGWYLEYLGPA